MVASASAASSGYANAANSSASPGLTAKLVSRSFGVKLGKFGLDYTSQDLHLTPDESNSSSSQTSKLSQSNSFSNELEIAALRAGLYDNQSNNHADANSSQSATPSSSLLKRCISAYSSMASSYKTQPQSILLGVA